jgi:hypothetical protein
MTLNFDLKDCDFEILKDAHKWHRKEAARIRAESAPATSGQLLAEQTDTILGPAFVAVVHHLDALRPNGTHPVCVKVAARLDDGQQIRLFCVTHGDQFFLKFRTKRFRRVKRRRLSAF